MKVSGFLAVVNVANEGRAREAEFTNTHVEIECADSTAATIDFARISRLSGSLSSSVVGLSLTVKELSAGSFAFGVNTGCAFFARGGVESSHSNANVIAILRLCIDHSAAVGSSRCSVIGVEMGPIEPRELTRGK